MVSEWGPSCRLQMQCKRMISHLFLHCTLSVELWSFFYSLIGPSWAMPWPIKEAYECCKQCTVSVEPWSFFYSLIGLSWVMPRPIKEAKECWNVRRVDKAIKRIWRMVPATIFWHLWNERNHRCFDGNSTTTHILFS